MFLLCVRHHHHGLGEAVARILVVAREGGHGLEVGSARQGIGENGREERTYHENARAAAFACRLDQRVNDKVAEPEAAQVARRLDVEEPEHGALPPRFSITSVHRCNST